MRSDEEAAAFLEQDLSQLDFNQFRPANFVFEAETEPLTLRLPESLLEAIRLRADAAGIPSETFIRQILERAVSSPVG